MCPLQPGGRCPRRVAARFPPVDIKGRRGGIPVPSSLDFLLQKSEVTVEWEDVTTFKKSEEGTSFFFEYKRPNKPKPKSATLHGSFVSPFLSRFSLLGTISV